MPSKFQVGDRVRFTGHELKVLTGKSKKPAHRHLKSGVIYTPDSKDLELIDRNRPRTITKIKYDRKRRRNLYYLRSHGELKNVPFDSTQLTTEPAGKRGGSKRKKRPYHFHRKYHRINHRKRS